MKTIEQSLMTNNLDPFGLRIDSFTCGEAVGEHLGLRITHLKTGLSVEGKGVNGIKLRIQLLDELGEKIRAAAKDG